MSKNFGGVRALSDVSFSVEPEERRLIIGPNGAGKTTLFNMLAGSFPVSSGTITLFGRDITELPAYERARMGLARTFQITNLFPRLTVLENVLLALQAPDPSAFSMLKSMGANRHLFQDADTLLEKWGLTAIAGRTARENLLRRTTPDRPHTRHGGSAEGALLDEPTAGLSAAEVVRVVGMIRSLPKETTILMIEHDMAGRLRPRRPHRRPPPGSFDCGRRRGNNPQRSARHRNLSRRRLAC